MDELHLSTIWQNDQNSLTHPSDTPTLTLSHLRIQGAIFDGKELHSVSANTPPFTEAPVLKIFWTKEVINLIERLPSPDLYPMSPTNSKKSAWTEFKL